MAGKWITFPLILIALLLAGCQPKFDLLGDAEELYVIYGVLNPQDTVQWVKVQQVWQVQGDATVYAAETDESAKGLRVAISGGGRTWIGMETTEIQRDSGLFGRQQTLYKFRTRADSTLKTGVQYQLSITRPDRPDFVPITAQTRIPGKPMVTGPSNPNYNIHTYLYSFPSVEFTDEYVVYFRPSDARDYEVRVGFEYWVDGQQQTAHWGPTRLFDEPIRCRRTAGFGELCYQIPEGTVASAMRAIKEKAGAGFVYLDEPRQSGQLADLPESAWVEVTAVDTALSLFLASNQSFGFGTNLLMDKADYGNISGGNIGIFGSYSTDKNYVHLSECTKYAGGWISVQPSFCP